MAITPTALTHGSSTTDATSIATASVTPNANQVVYAAVFLARGSAIAAAPTCTGNSLTWAQVATIAFDSSGGNHRRLTVFRAFGASPTAGAITFDFGGVTMTSFIWSVIQCAGATQSGTNGSGATVQSATYASASNETGHSLSLSALANNQSINLTFVGIETAALPTKDASFTTLAADTVATGNSGLNAEWLINATACNPTWASQYGSMVSIEVMAESLATVADTEDADTLSATATVLIQGSESTTESTDTVSATAGVLIQGAASITESADTLSATADVQVSGAASITEAADTIAATGTVSDFVAPAATTGGPAFGFVGYSGFSNWESV